jgi:hypothetical protein
MPSPRTSVTLLGPPFRLLASTGPLRWFVNRRRLVHSFAANLRGPAQPLTFAGAPLRAVIPIPNTTGNVPVTFAALSYAGTLRLTVRPGPAQVPDVEMLTAATRQDRPARPGCPATSTPSHHARRTPPSAPVPGHLILIPKPRRSAGRRAFSRTCSIT